MSQYLTKMLNNLLVITHIIWLHKSIIFVSNSIIYLIFLSRT